MKLHPFRVVTVGIVLLVGSLVGGCSPKREAVKTPPMSQASLDLSEPVAKALLKRCRAQGRPSEREGSLVTTDGHRVAVTAKIDHLRITGGQQFVDLAVALGVDGKPVPALDARGVGMGRTREQAVQVAANEWSQTVGVPLIRILAPEKAPDPKARYRLEPGAAGVRGKIEPDQFQALRPQLRKALDPFARSLARGREAGSLHALSLTVSVDRAKGVDGQCQVDGKTSPELLADIRKLPWPPGDYQFKRSYLIQVR